MIISFAILEMILLFKGISSGYSLWNALKAFRRKNSEQTEINYYIYTLLNQKSNKIFHREERGDIKLMLEKMFQGFFSTLYFVLSCDFLCLSEISCWKLSSTSNPVFKKRLSGIILGLWELRRLSVRDFCLQMTRTSLKYTVEEEMGVF